jgi:hypothetical protein
MMLWLPGWGVRGWQSADCGPPRAEFSPHVLGWTVADCGPRQAMKSFARCLARFLPDSEGRRKAGTGGSFRWRSWARRTIIECTARTQYPPQIESEENLLNLGELCVLRGKIPYPSTVLQGSHHWMGR